MELTVETIAVAAVFLLPGYAAYRLTNYFSKSPTRDVSTFDATLVSIGITLGILVVEVLVAVALAAAILVLKKEWLDELELELLVRSGIREYSIEHPWVVVLTFISVTFVTTGTAFLWGFRDPVGSWLEGQQRDLGISPHDEWVMAFVEDKEALGSEHVSVSVKVKGSGDVFQGWLIGFSTPQGKDRVRDIHLRHVTYIAGGNGSPISLEVKDKFTSAAILSSNDIESVTILYELPP